MFASARTLVLGGLESRAYPAAVIEVGRGAAPLWREAFGHLTYAAEAAPCDLDTIFDLASLTKVLATTPFVMRQVAAGRLSLDTRVAALAPHWRGADRSDVTIRHLLDHSSGLPAHVRFWERTSGRAGFEAAICDLPLERAPGAASVYSDPGFILLGLLIEHLGSAQLDEQLALVAGHLDGELGYTPSPALRVRIAPTEDDPWRGRVLCGEVHDENAAAIGGVAGHAGLFGTAGAVGSFARAVLRSFQEPTWLATPALMRTFARRTDVPGSSRALGWDTMRPTSSCGTLMSATAIGHTGFTGTSLWIDWERDLYVVFLTNRVHPTRANEALAALRPKLHDAVVEGLEA